MSRAARGEARTVDAAVLFSKSFLATQFEQLPACVVEATKKEVLDTLGVAVAGIGQAGVAQLQQLITAWGGTPESSVIGSGARLPAPHAAQINASLAHALDYDDVHETAVMHPGVATIPPALAAAELVGGVSGKAFITAVALGVDMICRLGLATRPGVSPIHTGWHFTSLYGYPTAALTAGKILGLRAEELVSAFGIAYHQCSGNGQCVTDGALTKRLGPGFAVRAGLTAAMMAARGITGARDSLEGPQGLYAVYHGGQYDREVLLHELGERFEGERISLKPYPCCRGIHASIDAALALVRERRLPASDIERVVIRTGAASHRLLCTPEEAKLQPRNVVDAQFSIPWGVAVALLRGGVSMGDYTAAAVSDAAVLDLTRRMRAEIDPALSSSRGVEPACLEITLRDGTSLLSRVDSASGSPVQPMSFEDCARKFRDCIAHSDGRLSDRGVARAIETTAELEKVPDVRVLIELFCRPPRSA